MGVSENDARPEPRVTWDRLLKAWSRNNTGTAGFAHGAIAVAGFFDLALPPPASLILNHRGFWKYAMVINHLF